MTEIEFGKHFQSFELLLADIVELLPTDEQETDLRKLLDQHCDMLLFTTAEEIKSLGVDTLSGDLKETIGDHTIKKLQENEGELMKVRGVNTRYTVDLN